MDKRFDTYLKELAADYRDGGTEHTGRSRLQKLLEAFAVETMDRGTEVQHEGGREGDKGAPDFKIKRKGMILGYVEVKTVGENLDKVLKTSQIEKYRKLSDNILVTDYLQFIRIDGAGKVVAREQLSYPSDLEGRTLRINPERAEAVSKLLEGFFSSPPQGLARAEKLAVALATRSRLLRDSLTEELVRQEKAKQEGRLHALFDVFRDQVFHGLEMKEFADAFAQMLAYGLFLAKLNAGDDDIIRLDNVRRFIPGSFRLIRELVRFLEEMQEAEYDEAKWVIDEILSIVNGLAIEEIRGDLSFRQRKAISRNVRAGDAEEHRLFERDPFIYFYEDFLKAYDKETRKARGVYYTPPPVVNFIVRAVDDILRDTFKIADGLADHRKVTVLDFAAGTGTFLLEVMQRIFDNIGGPESGKAASVVREHMLKNLYGFEYLIAPYTIAHLKLSQYLKDKGHPLEKDERLQVYLTNTLEPVAPQKNAFLPQLSAEVEEAQKVKEKPILVILGNPPYSGNSKNKGKWITQAIDGYRDEKSDRFVPGYKHVIERVYAGSDESGNEKWKDEIRSIGERNPKYLQDDYVKFIRFAQLKMDAVEEGIVGIITNHSWLDNPTFRGMRQSLMRSFDQIYVFDLHGNTKKKERAPDGGEDQNVFDIEQGVAISLFIKRAGSSRGIVHGELWGSRLSKYQRLASLTGMDAIRECFNPAAPLLIFRPYQEPGSFASYIKLDSAFTVTSTGMKTHRDEFAVAFTKEEASKRLLDLLSDQMSIAALRERYYLRDTAAWSTERARSEIRALSDSSNVLSPCFYRPFDFRWCIYGPYVMDRPRRELATHIHRRSNLVLLCPRQTKNDWAILVTEFLADHKSISDYDTGYTFPLYTFSDIGDEKSENLSPDFRAFLDARYDHHYSPEEILGYIYAVLHAPTYRRLYAESLRIDFPHLPFAEEADDFETLSALGWALVRAHLMRDLPKRGLGDYHGRGDNIVEHVRWSGEDSRISINATQSFEPVPEAVWNFHIGGYQVLDKYLKSRKGRILSLDEINHIGRIADALAFTIDQMEKIDAAYVESFPQ